MKKKETQKGKVRTSTYVPVRYGCCDTVLYTLYVRTESIFIVFAHNNMYVVEEYNTNNFKQQRGAGIALRCSNTIGDKSFDRG